MNINHKIILFILFSTLLCLSGCQNNLPTEKIQDHNSLYFLVIHNDENNAQKIGIYTSKLDHVTELNPIYLAPSRYPITALPASEQALLSNCTENLDECVLPRVPLIHSIDHFLISPNKKFLSWVDSLTYCQFSTCYGQLQIVVYDIAKAELRILQTIPLHAPISPLTQVIENLTWSPDSQYIGYIKRRLGLSYVEAVDIYTGQTYAADGNEDYVWDYTWEPLQNQMIYIGKGKTCDGKNCNIIAKFSPKDETTSFLAVGDWDYGQNILWSDKVNGVVFLSMISRNEDLALNVFKLTGQENDLPIRLSNIYGNRMTLSHAGEMTAIVGAGGRKLIIYNLVTNTTIAVLATNELRYGDNLTWSADDKILAVNTFPQEFNQSSNGVAFINTENGNVETILNLEGIREKLIWNNSDGDQTILLLKSTDYACDTNIGDDLYSFDIENNKLRQIEFSEPLKNEIAHCSFIITELFH